MKEKPAVIKKYYDVPDCIINFFRYRDFVDADYHLYASGRALGWVRMAADAIETSGYDDLKLVEYHAYAGISAARTAVVAVASWLRVWLLPGRTPGPTVDLAKDKFREQVCREKPEIGEYLRRLGNMAQKEIDHHRQRAQHREGLALDFGVSGSSGQWYLKEEGIPRPGRPIVALLRDLADKIEDEIRGMLGVLSCQTC